MHEDPSQTSGERAQSRILRVWRGATDAVDAERYVAYMSETGYVGLRATPGNLGVFGLLRVEGGRAEHVVMSLWESEAAIHRFAGDDIGQAVFYPDDASFLVDKDERVDHFTVVFEDGWR
jgi:heme-degrading monooxygenase HmoA